MEYGKPPVGVKPRWLYEEDRMYDLLEAIVNYINTNYAIPNEWIEEFMELNTNRTERILNRQKENEKV